MSTAPTRPVLALERILARHMHCDQVDRKNPDSALTCGRPYPDTAGGWIAFRTAHLAEVLTAHGVTA